MGHIYSTKSAHAQVTKQSKISATDSRNSNAMPSVCTASM